MLLSGFADPAKSGILEGLLAITITGCTYIFVKSFFGDIVDEIYDDNTALVIKNSGDTETLLLSEINYIDATLTGHFPRAAIHVAKETKFGRRIRFVPGDALTLYDGITIVDDLNARIKTVRGY